MKTKKTIVFGQYDYNKEEIERQIRYLKGEIKYYKEQLKIWGDALREFD